MNTPAFDERLPFLNQFILELVDEYHTAKINSWDALDEKVKSFFTAERMEETEALVPGWKKLASYSEGITLTHVMCVFLGAYIAPEFQAMAPGEQQMAKWIVLFHDVEKIHIHGKRDYTHAFRSAITTARALKEIGFPITEKFDNMIHSWSGLTASAVTDSTTQPGEKISDNRKLPQIIRGIEDMYGMNTPATLIIKGVLLHMSINVVKDWPQPAPLSDEEIERYVEKNLCPLLKVMMLADNEGWSMFYPDARAAQRNETLEAFQRVENMIRQ